MATHERVDIKALLRTTSRWSASATLLVAVPVVALLTCSEPAPRPLAELVRRGDLFLDPQTLEPYSGPIFATFSDRPMSIAARVSLRRGTFDGVYEKYFENHRVSAKEMYRNGRRDGPYEWYFESGRLFESGTYRRGVLDGPYEAFWESGDITEAGTYKAGQYDGMRSWYANGRLIERVTYVDGVIDGPYERYTREGVLEARGALRDGQPCGSWVEGGEEVEHAACTAEVEE